MTPEQIIRLHGAIIDGRQVRFSLWAPRADSALLDIQGQEPVQMTGTGSGWFTAEMELSQTPPGTLYGFRLNGSKQILPDPASRFQPESVHSRSMLIPEKYQIHDEHFLGNSLENLVIEEIHVGTFTERGTLADAAENLYILTDLGINAVELMPLAAFDGEHGWGYDGVQPFSVHRAYGGPDALASFVEKAHSLGISVLLDVVYNHFGPSGCYESLFAPWFSRDIKTPWGQAIDYTKRPIRDFFVQNALFWIQNFHLDGLRLDAVHAIRDTTSRHILAEISEAVLQLPPRVPRAVPPILIGESHLNDAIFVRSTKEGGMGLTTQWSDDLHHALHAVITGEKFGVCQDFGSPGQVAKALTDGQTFCGEYASLWNGPRGTPTDGLSGSAFIVFSQNHDQIGNRPEGERLAVLTDDDRKLKLAAAAVLLSPFVPMIFMGEAWAETAPFLYFTDFPDEGLGKAVSEGRKKGFSREFQRANIPDPQEKRTFERSKIHPEQRLKGRGKEIWNWYKKLIAVRRSFQKFTAERVRQPPSGEIRRIENGSAVGITRPIDGRQTCLLMNFGEKPAPVDIGPGTWRILADSTAAREAVSEDPGKKSQKSPPYRKISSGTILLCPWQALFLLRDEDAGSDTAS